MNSAGGTAMCSRFECEPMSAKLHRFGGSTAVGGSSRTQQNPNGHAAHPTAVHQADSVKRLEAFNPAKEIAEIEKKNRAEKTDGFRNSSR
jgi:hypothetical protein